MGNGPFSNCGTLLVEIDYTMATGISEDLQNTYAVVTEKNELGITQQKYISRPNSFRIHIQSFNRAVTTTELLEALINAGVRESNITCFARVDNRTYDITLYDVLNSDTLHKAVENITVGDNVYTSELAPNIIWENKPRWTPVTIFGLPFEVDDKVVMAKFTKYGDPEGVKHQTFKNYPYIQSGVRIIKMVTITKPIPNHLFIKGIRVSVKYEGSESRPRMCYICRKIGHIASECNTEHFPDIVSVITESDNGTAEIDNTIIQSDEPEPSIRDLENAFDGTYNDLLKNLSQPSQSVDQSAMCADQAVSVVREEECERESEMDRESESLSQTYETASEDGNEREEGEISEEDLVEQMKEIRKRTLIDKKKDERKKERKDGKRHRPNT